LTERQLLTAARPLWREHWRHSTVVTHVCEARDDRNS
jgi:hypothetical protein